MERNGNYAVNTVVQQRLWGDSIRVPQRKTGYEFLNSLKIQVRANQEKTKNQIELTPTIDPRRSLVTQATGASLFSVYLNLTYCTEGRSLESLAVVKVGCAVKRKSQT